jgi:RHS repeat-associated protein
MPRIRRRTAVAQCIAGVALTCFVTQALSAPGDITQIAAPMLGADPPKAESLADGDTSVSTQTGALTYSYPITVPPGRLGNQPSLALSYSSQAPIYGGVAAGWTLSIPEITRDTSAGILQQVSFQSTPPELMKFTSSLAGGRPLVEVYGDKGAAVFAIYRAQNDTGYARYERMSDGQPYQWRVLTPDGLTYYFGDTSLVAGTVDRDRVPLTRTVDPFGNTVEYQWTSQGASFYRLDEIRYTSNPTQSLQPFAKVSFTWTAPIACRVDGDLPVGASRSFRTGEQEDLGRTRLDKITVQAIVPGTTTALHTREVTLGYSASAASCAGLQSPYRELTSIQESAWHAGQARVDLPAVTFSYGQLERQDWEAANYGAWTEEDDVGLTWGTRFGGTAWPQVKGMLLDLDGDGLMDRLTTSTMLTPQGHTCAVDWERNTGTSFQPRAKIPLPSLHLDQRDPGRDCALNGQYTDFQNLPPSSQCGGVNNGTYLAYRWLDVTGDALPDLVTAIHHDADSYDPNRFDEQPFGDWPLCNPPDDQGDCLAMEEECVRPQLSYCDGEACGFKDDLWKDCFNVDPVPCNVMMRCEPGVICDPPGPGPGSCSFPRSPHERCGRYPWMIYENLGNGQLDSSPRKILSPVPLESDNGDSPSGGGGFSSSKHAVIDIDGDGYLDAVVVAAFFDDPDVESSPMFWFVWKGDGTGAFHGDPQGRPFVWFVPEGASTGSSWSLIHNDFTDVQSVYSMAGLADLNGDGLQDLYWRKDWSATTVEVYWNKGNKFSGRGERLNLKNPTLSVGHLVPSEVAPGGFVIAGERSQPTRMMDYDGDGRADLVFSEQLGEDFADPTIVYNDGSNFLAEKPLTGFELQAVDQETLAYDVGELRWRTVADLIDIDGDGIQERVYAAGNTLAMAQRPRTSAPPRLMTGYANGRGLHTAIAYAPITDRSVVASDVSNRKAAPSTQWVVQSITTTDDFEASPATTSYRYTHPVWNQDDQDKWGFRGFESVLYTGPRGERTEERYDYTPDWSGRLQTTLTYPAETNPGTTPTSPTSITETTWQRYTLFAGRIETFHPTITRTYTCGASATNPLLAQTESECRSAPAALKRTEDVWTALRSTTQTEPIDLLYARTRAYVQDGEVFDQGDRYVDETFALHSNVTTYRLRSAGTRAWWLDGTAEQEFGRTATIWDSTYREAREEHTYLGTSTIAKTARTYHPEGNVWTITKPEQYGTALRTTLTYDTRKLFVATGTNELGHVVGSTFDYGTGVQLTSTGPNATNESRTDIDGLGRPVATWVRRTSGNTTVLEKVSKTTYVDTPSGTTPTSITRENLIDYGAARWTNEKTSLDGHGRPIRIATRANASWTAETTYDYASDGTLVTVTVPDPSNDAGTVAFSYTYDSIGRPTGMRRPAIGGSVASGVDVTYDGVTETRTEIAGSLGGPAATTVFGRDALGRLETVSERLPDGSDAVTTYGYDPRDAVAEIIDPEDNVTTLTHDWGGRRVRVERGSRTWTYAYDRNGNMTMEWSPGGLDYVTTFAYDALDRPDSKYVGARAITGTDRDLFGVGPGKVIDYTYDAGVNGVGSLHQVIFPTYGGGSILKQTFAYDAEGNVTQEDRAARFAGVANSKRQTTTYGPGGRVVEVNHGDRMSTAAGGGTRSKVTYDDRALPYEMTMLPAGQSTWQMVARMHRNRAGLVQYREKPTITGSPTQYAQWASWVYDPLGRITDVKVNKLMPSGTQLARQAFTYWGLDDPRTLSHQVSGLTTRNFTYTYDSRHQLVSTSTSPQSFGSSYAFTTAGRLDRASAWQLGTYAGADLVQRNVQYEYLHSDPEMVSGLRNVSGGALHTSNEYDPAGALSRQTMHHASNAYLSLLWDADDQLRRVTKYSSGGAMLGREEYFYDADGQRAGVVKRSSTNAITEVRFFQGSIEHWQAGAELITVTKSLAHLSLGTPVARVENASTIEYQYHSPTQSLLAAVSTASALNASFVYGPYGELLQSGGAQTSSHRRRYNDKYKDELTNFGYYGYRYYDQVTQTWISGDPLFRFAPDAAWTEPRKANLYTFDLGNPNRYVDPDGRQPDIHAEIAAYRMENPEAYRNDGPGLWQEAKDKIQEVAADIYNATTPYADASSTALKVAAVVSGCALCGAAGAAIEGAREIGDAFLPNLVPGTGGGGPVDRKMAAPTAAGGGGAAGIGAGGVADGAKKTKKRKQTGSYTNTHASGKRYHGKGSKKRSQKSGRRVARKNGDPHVATDWTPAENDREAFKQESRRLEADGGHTSDSNYNLLDSPGSQYRIEDGDP